MSPARKVTLWIIPLLVAFLASGCSLSGQVNIGVYEPMTGCSASSGQAVWEGIRLANRMYPEVLGKKVHLYLEDNGTDKAGAANAVARLIDQREVIAILGSYGSTLSLAGGAVAKSRGIPVVGCSPTDPKVTKDNSWYFRACFADPLQGRAMAKYAFDRGARRAAIVKNSEDEYSRELAASFRETFTLLTGDKSCVGGEFQYSPGDRDFTPQLLKIAALQPDVVFAPGNYGDSALLIRQAGTLGISARFLGGDSWGEPEFLEIGGRSVEGASFTTHYCCGAHNTPEAQRFEDAFKKAYNKDPGALAALGYDAYLLVLEAIRAAGKPDPVFIRDSLARINRLSGATGTITVDSNRDASKSVVLMQVKDGRFQYLTTVEPF